jgi:phosphohistidine phosphatase
VRKKRIRPRLVLCSPSVRTRRTLEAIKPSLGKSCTVELVPTLDAASRLELLRRLRALPDSVASVMLIGHNPGLQELALALATHGADLPRLKERLPTGALATLVADCESWMALKPGDAELVDYVAPEILADGDLEGRTSGSTELRPTPL